MTKENKKWSCVLLAALAGLFASHSLSAGSTERNNSNSLFAKFVPPANSEGGAATSGATNTSSPSASSESAAKTYQVKAGQGLWAVAQAAWGSGNDWKRLITLNPALANRPTNADGSPVIYVGEYLNV